MKEIRTVVEIDAPAERVWSVLTDFPEYSNWNPFVQSISGEAREEGRLEITVAPPGGSPMRFKPTVLRARQGEELRWLGKLIVGGVFDGEHIFQLESIDSGDRTRFHHREEFRGLLVPLFWKSLESRTRAGFEAMNEALKRRVEAM